MAQSRGTKPHVGVAKDYVQFINPLTGHYVKVDIVTGKITDVQKSRFKGVKFKKVSVQAHPAIKRSTALKIERAFISNATVKRGEQKK
jgi:hypothetical protein